MECATPFQHVACDSVCDSLSTVSSVSTGPDESHRSVTGNNIGPHVTLLHRLDNACFVFMFVSVCVYMSLRQPAFKSKPAFKPAFEIC